MGQVMISVNQVARLRSQEMTKLLMKQRKSIVRRARWRNSYANLKKLVAKNSRWIRAAAFTFFFGLAVATDWSLVLSNFSKVFAELFTAQSNAIAVLIPKPAVVSPPAVTAPKIESIISTPVAASGDETLPSLKLSTNLLFTNPPESNKP